MLYVEDLIERLSGTGRYLFESALMPQVGWEWNFVTSLSTQISNNNALTEKQATMAVKLLHRYKPELERALLTHIHLDSPQFRKPFRIITDEKSISIGSLRGEQHIIVRFPYDPDVIKRINEYAKGANWKSIEWNTPITSLLANWESEEKFWRFALVEENILWVGMNLLDQGFKASDEFLELYSQVIEVVNNIDSYAPMIIKDQGVYTYKNCSDKIVPIATDNVIEFLFNAKTNGVTAWNDEVDEDFRSTVKSPVTKSLLNTMDSLWVDSTVHSVDVFEETLKYGGPILVIIPGGSEIEHTVLWHQMALEFGIPNDQMSVMFRTPNQNGGEFNKYIKDHNLNNEVNEHTKIVFVSTKIPKPLVKSDIRFNTVLNLGFYNQLHFSMSVLLNSTTNVVYYTNKKPNGATFGHR